MKIIILFNIFKKKKTRYRDKSFQKYLELLCQDIKNKHCKYCTHFDILKDAVVPNVSGLWFVFLNESYIFKDAEMQSELHPEFGCIFFECKTVI